MEPSSSGGQRAATPPAQQPETSTASPSTSTGTPTSATKLFLGGLSWSSSAEKLRSYFSKFGEVEDAVVMLDRVTKQPRGFGFVTFKEPEAAQSAVQSGPHSIDERLIDCKPSVPIGHHTSSSARSRKVFVGGLSPETTEEEFRTYFGAYGTVTEAQIMVDPATNRSRGFGFVTFEDEESVQRVFAAGAMHHVAGKHVEVKAATPKGSGPQPVRAPAPGGQRAVMPGGRGALGAAGRGVAQPGYGMYPGMPPGYAYPGYGLLPAGQYPGYGYGMPASAYAAAAGYPGMVPYAAVPGPYGTPYGGAVMPGYATPPIMYGMGPSYPSPGGPSAPSRAHRVIAPQTLPAGQQQAGGAAAAAGMQPQQQQQQQPLQQPQQQQGTSTQQPQLSQQQQQQQQLVPQGIAPPPSGAMAYGIEERQAAPGRKPAGRQ